MDITQTLLTIFKTIMLTVLVGGIIVAVLGVVLYVLYMWNKYRHREHESLNSTLLQISVPRDNEIKIDAAEQLFASLASIRKTNRLHWLKPQPHISFEIVGMPGDIRFYVYVHQVVESSLTPAIPADLVQVAKQQPLGSPVRQNHLPVQADLGHFEQDPYVIILTRL